MNEYRKNKSSSNWKAIIITFSIIGGLLLGGGLIWFLTKNKRANEQIISESQRQQTNNAVSQLANNLLGNADNLNKLTKKSDGTAKTIEEIEEEFLISAISPPKPTGSESVGGTLPPEIIDKVWDELRPWIEEYLKDLNKSILDHAREKFRRDIENWLRWQQREYNRQLEEYQRLLKELRTIKELIDKYQSIREKELLDRLSRRNELIAKGYSDRDIELIKKWDLLDQEIPDLNAERRIGVTSILWTSEREWGKIGGSSDLIIFLKPKPGKRDPQIKGNINQKNPEMVINFSAEIAHRDKEDYKTFIRNFLAEKGRFDNDIYCLIRTNASMSGPSAGIAYYLVLYSLINQIPLPRNLASTGAIKGQQVGPIGGLDLKLEYNVKKNPPINTFILCFDNKKDKRHPSQSYEDIPLYIKEKVKQVEFVRFTNEIPLALERILNPGMAPRNVPIPPEPEPKIAEVQATPEQLLAYFFDGGWCGVSGSQESKVRQTKDSHLSIPPASPLFGPLQNLFSIQYKEVSDKTKNLYEEYKAKLNSSFDADEWYQNELEKLEKSNSNQNNEDDQEKVSEVQEKINKLKTEAAVKRKMAEQAKINEQRIIEIEKEIAEHKQAKANEEVILENINRKIEENRQNPNQNPDQNLEADKQAVSQRIAELSAKIASSEEEIANLRQNQQESIKEVEELEFQLKDLEGKLQRLLRKQKSPNSPSSRELENKRRQLEQEYQLRKKLDQSEEQIYREYENKFKEIAAPLVNLIPEIQKQLTELGYKKIIIQWKQGEQFGRIHLTTLEPSVTFEVEKN